MSLPEDRPGPSRSLAAGRKVSHFRVISKIGEGGMGQVYKAEDERLRRIVALKVLPPDLVGDPDRRHRFLREAQAAASVAHPNIAVIHEAGEDEGVVFIAMEFVEGRILRSLLAGSPLPVRDVLRLASEIAEGLARAHQAGVVHRDLKPENVMVQPNGRSKILDFGLAKVFEHHRRAGLEDPSEADTESVELTQEGVVLGTAAYMSPEQARGRAVDARSDLFSLGVLLYEMLTGHNPFRGTSSVDTLGAILVDLPPPVTDANPEVPPDLARVVETLLAKEPRHRYASAEALLGDLAALRQALEQGRSGPVLASRGRSIAVLPFADMSPERDQDYLCEGLAEELINALARVAGLRVAARTSTFQFKGRSQDVRRIGEALNVETILDGSVRKAGPLLRVTAQLVNVSDGYQLWSESFDREMRDVFALQDEIASAIVETLKEKLGVGLRAVPMARAPVDPEAFDLYLRGRYHWYRRFKGALREALSCFEKAIAKDPAYAPAWAGLADSYNILGTYGFLLPKSAFPQAKLAAERALSIDETLAEAHAALGYARFLFDWDWSGAERDLRRAIELKPGYVQTYPWYGLLLVYTGRHEEAVRIGRRAQELDPLSQYAHSGFAAILYAARRLDDAVRECRRALEIDPDNFIALIALGRSCSALSRHDEAIAALQRGVEISGRAAYMLSVLGSAYAGAGRRPEAEAVLAELHERSKTEYVMPLLFAWVHAALGESEPAFAWLDRAYEDRDPFLTMAKVVPVFDKLRPDPRFDRLLRRMRLSPGLPGRPSEG